MTNSTHARIGETEFELFRDLAFDKIGISLSNAKRSLVESRLAKRLRELGLATYHDYYCYLMERDSSGKELQSMINCITTNKTDFFREPHHFTFLQNEVLADRVLQSHQGGSRKIRIWSAACSRGHEPYTIAMTLLDSLPPAEDWDARILATDINTDVLDHARRGVYPLNEIAEVPLQVKRAHFLRGTDGLAASCRVKSQVQQLVTFRRMNLVHDPLKFRSRFDVIFLRNVLIYFNRDVQTKVVARLKSVLKPGGYLILGHSENITWRESGFVPLGETIYQLTESVS